MDGAPLERFKGFHAGLAAYLRSLAETPQAPEQVRERLCELIGPAPQQGKPGHDAAQELRYLMAAFADEMLITRPWAHQQAWLEHLVEVRLFGTRNAGDRVFARIRELHEPQNNPARRALALPYMYALALGFRGRFGAAHEPELERLRARLFALARGRAPDPLFTRASDDIEHAAAQRLMGRAYEHTVAHGAPLLLPNPYRWRAAFCFCFGALLLVALSIWSARTRELREHVDQAARARQQASRQAAPSMPPMQAMAMAPARAAP